MNNHDRPIGIFDSGLGGLTVAQEIQALLPDESIIYIGDTAHLPYGDKSKTTITHYSLKITDYLLAAHCKAIVIACHSASAAAFESVLQHVNQRALILNVIDPVIDYCTDHYQQQKVAMIGTRQTVNSQVFQQKIANAVPGMTFVTKATPLFALLVEEGFAHKPDIIMPILQEYFNHAEFKAIKAMILACTHYPLLKDAINQYYQNSVHLIDCAKLAALALQQMLTTHDLLAATKTKHQFYITDYTPAFEKMAKTIFKEAFPIHSLRLWQ